MHTLVNKKINNRITYELETVGCTELTTSSDITLLAVIGEIVKRLTVYLHILKHNNLIDLVTPEKYIFKHVFKILKCLELKSVDGKFIIKIIKVLRRDGKSIIYNNIVRNNMEMLRDNELLFNIFYYKPTTLKIDNIPMVCPGLILFAIKLVKDIPTKEKTIVTDDFIKAFNIAMSTSYYIDVGMLELIRGHTKKHKLELRGELLCVLKKFQELSIEGISIESTIVDEAKVFEIFLKKVLKKLYEEVRIESKRLLLDIREGCRYQYVMVEILKPVLDKYNKRNKLNILLPHFPDYEAFFYRNRIIFRSKEFAAV
jgi:hypothetical protein